MNVQNATDVSSKATSADAMAVDLARWTADTLLGLLATAALLVAWRRIAGALCSPLDPLALVAVGLVVAMAAGGVRWLWARLPAAPVVGRSLTASEHEATSGDPAAAQVDAVRLRPTGPSLLLSACVAILGLSLVLPETPLGGLLAFWTVVIVEEIWTWRPLGRRNRRPAPPAGTASQDAPQLRIVGDEPAPSPSAADDVPPQEVLQQLTRSQAADGSEQLVGWLRMAFAAGQRTGSLHVAFCPPFAKTPELMVEQLDGPDARIKTAQLLPYGVRLDLKLAAAPAAPGSVLLQFSARSDGGSG
jgi:hypothetical protein